VPEDGIGIGIGTAAPALEGITGTTQQPLLLALLTLQPRFCREKMEEKRKNAEDTDDKGVKFHMASFRRLGKSAS
jgi:hypothetical protein